MILYASDGMLHDEIAACLDTRREVVSLWRRRFFADRLPGVGRTRWSGSPPDFPPRSRRQVKALACELPAKYDLPLSRWSTRDLVQQVQQSGLVASVSGSTLWRWLHEDAIRPRYHRSWIFPRDPDFAVKAGRLLDLYARQWQGRPLKDENS